MYLPWWWMVSVVCSCSRDRSPTVTEPEPGYQVHGDHTTDTTLSAEQDHTFVLSAKDGMETGMIWTCIRQSNLLQELFFIICYLLSKRKVFVSVSSCRTARARRQWATVSRISQMYFVCVKRNLWFRVSSSVRSSISFINNKIFCKH